MKYKMHMPVEIRFYTLWPAVIILIQTWQWVCFVRSSSPQKEGLHLTLLNLSSKHPPPVITKRQVKQCYLIAKSTYQLVFVLGLGEIRSNFLLTQVMLSTDFSLGYSRWKAALAKSRLVQSFFNFIRPIVELCWEYIIPIQTSRAKKKAQQDLKKETLLFWGTKWVAILLTREISLPFMTSIHLLPVPLVFPAWPCTPTDAQPKVPAGIMESKTPVKCVYIHMGPKFSDHPYYNVKKC